MPAKNIVKQYIADSYYHVYNRGVAKQSIFLDEIDYKVFFKNLKLYLTPEPLLLQGPTLKSFPSRQLKNYFEQITLFCYCLMPNHFHLLVHQKNRTYIAFFMRSLLTKYSMYFNRKYKRVGPLFQSNYKAVRVETDEQLLHLSRYIHINPKDLDNTSVTSRSNLEVMQKISSYPYSSCRNYLGQINQSWLNTSTILAYFSTKFPHQSYQSFLSQSDETVFFPIADESLTIN